MFESKDMGREVLKDFLSFFFLVRRAIGNSYIMKSC